MLYRKSFYMLSTILIFSVTITFLSSAAACTDGKEFIKYWTGDGLATVSNVKITDQNGTVLYSDGVPSGNVNDIKGLYHNDNVTVQWKDWRGNQSEVIEVGCTDNICYVTNTIPSPPPPPKSVQQQSEQASHWLLSAA